MQKLYYPVKVCEDANKKSNPSYAIAVQYDTLCYLVNYLLNL